MTPQSDAKTSLHFLVIPSHRIQESACCYSTLRGLDSSIHYPDANYYLSQLEGITF